jgi:predicted DNA binding CopG/RHH family protein
LLDRSLRDRKRSDILKNDLSEQKVHQKISQQGVVMKNIRLTKEEQAIEDSIDKYVPVDAKTYKEMVQAIEDRKKDAVLSIRLSSRDLNSIKQKAHKLGVKYQTLIAEILHKVAQT